MQVKSVYTLPPPMPPLNRPASGVPAPGPSPSDQVEVGREAPKFWKGPARTGLTTTVGAASGAALGGLIGQSLLGAAVGGLLGGAAGAYVGSKWKQLHYDLQSKQLHRENRAIQKQAEETKADLTDKLDLEPAPMTPLKSSDLRAAREPGHSQRAYDGFDSSRDIVALYSREGSPEEPYRVDVQVAHLRPAAEVAGLDTVVALDWGASGSAQKLPFMCDQGDSWKLAVRVDNDSQLVARDQLQKPVEGLARAQHSPTFNRIELEIDKEQLRQRGWQDGQPLRLQALATGQNEILPSSRLAAASDTQGNRDQIFRWEGKTVYYAVTDRFQNGDPSNDGAVDKNDPERFHGGDWQGVIDKLDYLKGLHVDCIWLSPPYLNERHYDGIANRGAPPKDGFHGYWPMDFSQPDPNWGDMAKLRELTDKAHEMGMKVMLDVVVNHTAYGHPWASDPARHEWFNHEGNINGLGQYTIEKGNLCYLPDLNQDNPEVSRYLIDVHKTWLEQGVDAFRVDAVRHVPEKFLREFDSAMRETRPGYFAVGEVFRQDPNYVSGYQNRTMDSMFDFPLAYAIRNVFAGDPSRTMSDRVDLFKNMLFHQPQEAMRAFLYSHKSAPAQQLSEVFAQDGLYDNPGRLGTLIDNHDMIRFLSDCGGDPKKLEQALGFLFAVRGTPHVYYGTEVGMAGPTHENRKEMQWDKNPELTDRFRELSGARARSQALQVGHQQELQVGDHTYAFSRMLPDEEVVCAFNNSDEPLTLTIPLDKESQIPDGAVLTDMLGQGQAVLGEDRTLEVTLPARGFHYLQWKE